MSDPTIKAALEAAAFETAGSTRWAASVVTRFLRALSDSEVLRLMSAEQDPDKGWRDTLAAAVEDAAR